MADNLDDVHRELSRLREAISNRDRRLTKVEKDALAHDTTELTNQVRIIKSILVGADGEDGLKKSVERLMVLVDGDEELGVTGITDQIKALKAEVSELVKLRNQIKWAIAGVLSMTALGNFEGIVEFLKTLF
jgi:hypothetical protein